MKPLKIIFLPTEPTQKKGVFDMNYSFVDGYLLAEDLEKQINDMQDTGYLFVKMEHVFATRMINGAAGQGVIGYLLFFEKRAET